MKIAIAQIHPCFGKWEANIEKHQRYTEMAIKSQADLVVFPEMSLSGYGLKELTPELAVTLQDERLEKVASLSQDIDIVAGFPELIPGQGYAISSAYFHQGFMLHVHRKIYLPINGMFDDLKDFRRGKSIQAFHVNEWTMGMIICRDMWHADAVQALVVQKAQMVIAASAVPLRSIGPNGPRIHEFIERTSRSYAERHTIYFVFSNRVGFEEGICFYGGSMIADPFGNIIAQAGFLEEEMILAEISLEHIHRRIAAISLKHEEDPALLLSVFDEEETI